MFAFVFWVVGWRVLRCFCWCLVVCIDWWTWGFCEVRGLGFGFGGRELEGEVGFSWLDLVGWIGVFGSKSLEWRVWIGELILNSLG